MTYWRLTICYNIHQTNIHNKIDHFCVMKYKIQWHQIHSYCCAYMCSYCLHTCVVLSCSVLFDSAILWTVAHQAPLSMGFPRQEYWSRFPFLSPGDLPHPGIEPASPITPALEEDSLPLGHLGSPYCCTTIKTCFVSNYKIWWQIFTYSWIL